MARFRSARTRLGPKLLALLAVAAGVLLLASPAASFHIPDARYRGEPVGDAWGSGSRIDFQVSADGKEVKAFAGEVFGPTCGAWFKVLGYMYPSGLPITNHRFSAPRKVMGGTEATFSGEFTKVQFARGHLHMRHLQSGCELDLNWTARTTASPAQSEECLNAKEAVKKAEQRLREARSPRAKQRARTQLRIAKDRQRAVC